MLVELKLEEPIVGEPTNEQLAEAADLNWFADDGNLFSLLGRGYVVENARTRRIMHSISSYRELGDEFAYTSNQGIAAKIIETPLEGQETYRRLSESLRSTAKRHTAELAVMAAPHSHEQGEKSDTPLTMTRLRFEFLASTADDLIRQPGTELPIETVNMAALVSAGFMRRFQMRKQLKPYDIALREWKSGSVLSYAEPQQEILKALQVTPALWKGGISQIAASILATQCLIGEQKENMSKGYHSNQEIEYRNAVNEEMEQALAFRILDIIRLRLEEELKIEIQDASRYSSSPYGSVMTKRPRFI